MKNERKEEAFLAYFREWIVKCSYTQFQTELQEDKRNAACDRLLHMKKKLFFRDEYCPANQMHMH